MPTKKQRAEKRTKMFSLKFYLQSKAAEKADKLQLRDHKRHEKLEHKHDHKEEHVHTEECNHEH